VGKSLRHRASAAFLVTLAAGMASCSGGPPAPPPPAIASAAGDGCFERSTGPDTWEVGCAGPADAAARAALLDRVLLHGAYLAEREGFPAFRLGATRMEAVTVVQHDYGDPSWGPGGPPHWGPISQAEHWRDYHHLRTAVTTTAPLLVGEIHLVEEPMRGDYRAAEILAAAQPHQAAPRAPGSAR
jgi:hypothetical protein